MATRAVHGADCYSHRATTAGISLKRASPASPSHPKRVVMCPRKFLMGLDFPPRVARQALRACLVKLEQLSSLWLPKLRYLQLNVPVILVGCKL